MKIILELLLILPLLAGAGYAAQPLRTAAQDSPPKYARGPGGSIGGIGIDIMRAIERVDPSIRFTGDQDLMPFKRIEIMLERDDLDVFFGFIRTDERSGKYVFIDPPLYRVADVLVAREDDPLDVQNLPDLAQMADSPIVLVASGTAQADQLKDMGVLVDDGGKTVAANLSKLLRNRGRLVMQSEIEILSEIREQKLQTRVRILPTRFNESGRYVAFSKGVPAPTVAKVQIALDKLSKSGELFTIFSRYR